MHLDKVNLSKKLREFLKDAKKNQVQLALDVSSRQRVKYHQSQISRAVNGRYRERTRSLEVLCEYAGINLKDFELKGIDSTSRDGPNAEIFAAIEKAWDRTPRGARILSRVILAVGRETT